MPLRLSKGKCRCSKCRRWKPVHLFHKCKRLDTGLQSYCKSCDNKRQRTAKRRQQTRRAKTLWKYGIFAVTYDAMLAKQNGTCAICLEKEIALNRSLSVDHNHKTGHIRGLLCGNCNRAIGLFRDDPQLLRRAADYVEKEV